jgi:hypothetical protein
MTSSSFFDFFSRNRSKKNRNKTKQEERRYRRKRRNKETKKQEVRKTETKQNITGIEKVQQTRLGHRRKRVSFIEI